jgi:hypothetical protein
MQDFEIVVHLILTRLYESFPIAVPIDRQSLSRALAGSDDSATLPSGVSAADMISEVVLWLRDEGYTHNRVDGSPWESVVLSTKGLAALKSKAPGLGTSTAKRLLQAVWHGRFDWSQYGPFVQRLRRIVSAVLPYIAMTTLIGLVVVSWVSLGWPAGKSDLGASARLLAASAAAISGMVLIHLVPGLKAGRRYALVALVLAACATLLALRWAYRGLSVFLEAQSALVP